MFLRRHLSRVLTHSILPYSLDRGLLSPRIIFFQIKLLYILSALSHDPARKPFSHRNLSLVVSDSAKLQES